jgi:GT2 family glycosyltransferase
LVETFPDEDLEHGALGRNALLNGDFESWSDGLSFTVEPGTIPIADEWELRNKNKSAVTVYADRTLTRDPQSGDAGELRHALSISSSIETDYVRLETEVHKANLEHGCDAYLEFYAKRCDMPAHQRLSAETYAHEVNEIFVLRRVYRDDQKDYHDEKLFTIASNVRPSRAGNRFCFRLKDDEFNQIYDPPRFRGDESQPGTIILCFEFRNVVDWTFTEVRLSSTAKPRTSGALGYVGLEDPNIVGQIGRLKMIENWNCAMALSVSRDTDEANADSDGMQAFPVFEPAHSAPSVEIVICVHNALDDVIRCLDSVRRNTKHPHSIALIDDGSRPDVRHRLEHYIGGRPWMRLVVNENNLGYTRTANLGLSRSSANWVVLLNSDTIVTPGWLEGLLECAYSDQSIKFVGPISNAASWQSMPEISDTAGKWKVNAVPAGASVDEIAFLVRDKSNRDFPKVPLLNGFCMLMEREALETLGFFDEQAFPKGFGEENDICVRATEAGFKLAIADHVYIYHRKSASFGRKRRDRLSHEGTQALKRKHPDVDWAALQQEMKESSVLAALRHGLRETIAAKYPLQ